MMENEYVPKPSGYQEFDARIYALGAHPCVDVPKRVSQALGGKSPVPVLGTLNGQSICANLTARAGGRLRMFVNARMRKASAVAVGDRVRSRLRREASAREEPLPADLEEALQEDPVARAELARGSPSDRRIQVAWLNEARQPVTRVRRIERLLSRLRANARNE